jgi:hypothetical protein
MVPPSYTVLTDFGNRQYFANAQVVPQLWPHLLFQYSMNSEPVPINMVYGEFYDEDDEDNEDEDDDDNEDDAEEV